MSGFSPNWLAMRESHDLRARNAEVVEYVAERFAHLPSMTIVDLACGTGATRRALAPHLPRPQHWHLIDNDLSLLARAGAMPSPAGCTTRTIPVDLAHDLEAALDGAPDLITCSALLDLVSGEWLERLATECAARHLPLYAALTYNGMVALEPFDKNDPDIVAAVNHHQLSDKGFGPALGPNAAQVLIELCNSVGYDTISGPADWLIRPEDSDMQRAVVTQWAQITQEMGALPIPATASWLARRIAAIDAGDLTIRVGHTDVFVVPTGTR
jgi:hypothetical protein